MKHVELAKWLKLIVVVIGLFGLVFCFWLIPAFGQDQAEAFPEVAYLFWPCLIFVWMSAVLCYIALFFLWKICDEISKDRSFTAKNARYLQIISRLALVESVLCAVGMIVLFLLNALHPSILLFFVLLIVVGFGVAIVAAIFSRLTLKAAELKQDQDLTI